MELVELPGEVHLQPVRQVPAVVEGQAEHAVARREHREVHGHVRLRARVRLHVCVLCAEQLLRARARELLDLVDDLAAAVVPLPGIPLRVLVRRHGTDRLEHRRPREVLGRDQLDLSALPVELPAEQLRDLRVDLRETRGAKLLEASAGRQPRGDPMPATGGGRRRPGPRLRAATRGSAPVRSRTVDGVPGSAPRSSSAPQPSRIRCGTSSSVTGFGPPGSLALVASTMPSCVDDVLRRRRKDRDADADRSGLRRRSATGTGRPGSGRRACTAPAAACGAGRSSSSGTASSIASTLAASTAVGCVARASLQLVESPGGPPRPASSPARRRCRSGGAPAARPGVPLRRPSAVHDPVAARQVLRYVRRPRSRRLRAARAISVARASCTSSTSAPSSTRARVVDQPRRLPLVDKRGSRLPVAHLRLERRRSRRL